MVWLMWNPVLVHSETMQVLEQDSCPVHTKHTVGSEIILDAPVVLQGDEAQVKARFSPFGDSANLDAR
jgi:hypothetical protein